MKKFVVAAIMLFVAFLSFWAGGRYGREPSTGAVQTPAPANPMEGQGTAIIAPSPGSVEMNPARRQLIGVKIAAVEKEPMTYTLRLYGRVVSDETRTYRVNSSTDCWIRELSEVTTGSIVKKDQILAEALAPSYYNAQATYLIALGNIDRIKQQLGGQLRHQQGDLANNQIRMAVQALQNLGITDAQTEELANTREARPYLQVRAPADGVVLSRKITLNQWFRAAEEFYTIADIGKVWVYADVYEDEAMHMRPGMTVAVKHAQTGMTFNAKAGEVLPLFDPAARTLKVRIDIDNPRYELRPDMFVDVEIPIALPPSLHVPADAVLDSGTMTIVYVDAGGGSFEPRRVETGWRLGRRVEITGGLAAGEKIAVSGNFLIDSESRMQTVGLGVRMSVDPVCGRYVDREQAEAGEMTVRHGNEMFYFDSKQCKEQFEKEPKRYLGKETAGRKTEDRDRPVLSGTKRSWLDMLKPSAGLRSPGKGGGDPTASKKRSRDDFKRSAGYPGGIDWDGPEKEGSPDRDWGTWGAFPGAKYLGVKPEPGQNTSREAAGPGPVGGKATAGGPGGPESAPTFGAPSSERNPGILELLAPDPPDSPPK